MSTFVFLHAHPDDEAIFTGGTIAMLSDAGHRVVVVFATSGELGRTAPIASPRSELGVLRRQEAGTSCNALGVQRVVFLDYIDSGPHPDPVDQPWGAFAATEVDHAADQLAQIVQGERATALLSYDAGGITGHPDHLHAHRVAARAVELADIRSSYEITVDREYLHFVDTHVAAVAGAALPRRRVIGTSTVEITNQIDVRSTLDRKHAAIAAHRTQIDDPTFGTDRRFDEVYGYEWFIRRGEPTALDRLDTTLRDAAAT